MFTSLCAWQRLEKWVNCFFLFQQWEKFKDDVVKERKRKGERMREREREEKKEREREK